MESSAISTHGTLPSASSPATSSTSRPRIAFTSGEESMRGKATITRLTPNIGAVIGNIDLAAKLDDEEIAFIRKALLGHQVIFFEDQHLTPAQHRDFAARFGALHT